MHDMTKTRMLLTTAVLAAVAALLAGPANAKVVDYGNDNAAETVAVEIGPGTIPYLSHGIGVDESLFSGERPLGLTGDSPLTRDAGESTLTRYPAQGRGLTTATSSEEDDMNWAAFGLGAAIGALVAAGVAGAVLTARHRGRVALP
jgi:hypothetical protein